MAKKRPNVIPIIEDARHPARYRMLMPMVRAPPAALPCTLPRLRPGAVQSCQRLCLPISAFGSIVS